MLALLLVIPGDAVGAAVEGTVSSYRADQSLWPWPRYRRRERGGAVQHASLAPVASPGRPSQARWSSSRTPGRVLWALRVRVVTAAIFYGVGVQYAGQPPLLLVSLTKATILVAVLFIDAELRLVPTPLVGLLATCTNRGPFLTRKSHGPSSTRQ